MSAPLIIQPDVELTITTRLRASLATHGYPSLRVSNDYVGGDGVWVRRDGGPTLDVIRETARVGVNVYKTGTWDNVSLLARTVSALMRSLADGAPIVKVDQTSGPSPVADDNGIPRIYLTFEVTTRGAVLS